MLSRIGRKHLGKFGFLCLDTITAGRAMKGIGMISQDDIDAFSDDLQIADEIVERARNGRRLDRIFHANEIAAFVRAYILMRAAAQEAGTFMAQLKEREEDGMKVHDPVRE